MGRRELVALPKPKQKGKAQHELKHESEPVAFDSDFWWVFALMCVAAAVAYWFVGPWFEDHFSVVKDRIGAGRPSLIVSAVSAMALLLAVGNARLVKRYDQALRIEVSPGLGRLLTGLVAVAVGMLIGRTIFT